MNNNISIYQRIIRKYRYKGFIGTIIEIFKAIGRLINDILIYRIESNIKERIINQKYINGYNCILYVIDQNYKVSQRYRVFNLIEALFPFGFIGHIVHDINLLKKKLDGYSLVIFFRMQLNPITKAFREKCYKKSIPTIFDIDDLVYAELPETYCYDSIRYQYRINICRNFKNMLEICDYVTASTMFLRDHIENLTGKLVYHIPNGLNQAQVNTALNLIKKPKNEIIIGFLSGTNTHNKDFELIKDALIFILEKYPQVSFVTVGHLDLPTCFKSFGNRVSKVRFMNFIELLKFCSQFYAVVVPLECNRIFCQAKTELKYVEQALIKVPVIASPTATYKSCINNGINGFLAENTKQWISALERLIDDRTLRDTLAENAFLQIRDRYFPETIAKTASNIYRHIIQNKIFT